MKLEEFQDLVRGMMKEQTASVATGDFAIPSKSYLKQNKKAMVKEAIRAMVKKQMMCEDSNQLEFDISGLSPQEQMTKKKELTQQNPGKKIVFKTE
jgi:hypothetical protein